MTTKHVQSVLDGYDISRLTLADTVRFFPLVLREVLFSPDDQARREWEVLQHRYGLNKKNPQTLEELGAAYNITRERVRQIEQRVTSDLSSFMQNKNAKREITPVQAMFFTKTGLLWREFMGWSDAEREDQLSIRLSNNQILYNKTNQPTVVLLLSLIGVEKKIIRKAILPKFPIDELSPIFVTQATAERLASYDVVGRIHELLTNKLIIPCTDVEITAALNGKTKSARYTIQQVRNALPLCSTVSVDIQGMYAAHLGLLTRADQVFRLLTVADEPMSVNELLREINRQSKTGWKKPITKQNLANQIIASKRFKPIGRSGYWALLTMDVETKGIQRLMIEALEQKNNPASETEIYDYVRNLRPAKITSVRMLLAYTPDVFVQLPNKVWALKTWRLDTQNLDTALPKYALALLRKQSQKTMAFAELRDVTAVKFGITKQEVSHRLRAMQGITVYKYASQTFITIGKNVVGESISQQKPKISQDERIHQRIYQLLDGHPTRAMSLAALSVVLVKEFQRPKASIYGIMQRTPNLIRTKISSRETLCTLASAHNSERGTLIEGCEDKAVRAELRRAVRYLTPSDVDICLMLLSKEFEAQVSVLYELRQSGTHKHRAHTDRNSALYEKIEFLVNTGMIQSNGLVYQNCRTIRNYVIHEKISSVDKKAELFRVASSITNLFLYVISELCKMR